MRQSILFSSLLLATMPFATFANQSASTMSNFNYDYAEARIGVSPLTFGAAASFEFHPNAHAYVLWESEFESDYSFAGGVGFHAPAMGGADITGDILYRMVDNKTIYDNDSGIDLSLGWRQWLTPQLEAGGKVGYYTINNKADTDEFYGSIHARYYTTELFSLGAEAKLNDIYGDQLMFSARYKF